MSHHAIHRFEIPVADLDRAQIVDCEGNRIGLHSPAA